MSLIRIPPMLRGEVGGAREVPAEGGTVRELLFDLMARFPGRRTGPGWTPRDNFEAIPVVKNEPYDYDPEEEEQDQTASYLEHV